MRARLMVRAAVLALAVVAGACGPDDVDPVSSEARRQAAIDQGADPGGVTAYRFLLPEERSCFDSIIEDSTREAALSEIGPDGDEARVAVFEATRNCVPSLVDQQWFQDEVAAQLSAVMGFEVDRPGARCVASYVFVNAADPARVLAVGRSDEADQVMGEAIGNCLADDLDVAFDGFAAQIGDDASLDALASDCRKGRMFGCDLLWFRAFRPGEYRQIAVACGADGQARSPERLCSEGLELGPDGLILASSEGLGRVSDECSEGDMVACDLLIAAAPNTSDASLVGASCGGRIAVAPVPDCRSRFGD
ncbi:MAG: hypothetical protein R2770_06480 [Acidimicrobiales bacterium]